MKIKDLVYRMVADWAEDTASANDVAVKAYYCGSTYVFSSSKYVYANLQRWVYFQVDQVIYDDDTPPADIKDEVDQVLANVEFLCDREAEDHYVEYGVEDYDVELFGNTFSAINLLREYDEIAFREMYLDWLDFKEREAMELC